MAILGLFSNDIVLLGCISAIIDFDVLCTLWVFKVDVLLMEKPHCCFVRLSKSPYMLPLAKNLIYISLNKKIYILLNMSMSKIPIKKPQLNLFTFVITKIQLFIVISLQLQYSQRTRTSSKILEANYRTRFLCQ